MHSCCHCCCCGHGGGGGNSTPLPTNPKITETKYLAFVHYCGYFTKGDPILITEFEIERAVEGKRLGKKTPEDAIIWIYRYMLIGALFGPHGLGISIPGYEIERYLKGKKK
jgi:hypothetical protein